MTLQDTLFVPMELNALVVNVAISDSDDPGDPPMATPFSINQRNYSNLAKFNTPEAEAFSGTAPKMGVHLHWVLPRGLRHGQQTDREDADSIEFPYLPNRWLVLRLPGNGNGDGRKGWVLASDRVVETGAANSTPYVVMDGSKIGGPIDDRSLGMTLSLEEWIKRKEESRLKQKKESVLKPAEHLLTALGINDVTFVAYAPGAKGVVAFHDDMDQKHDPDLDDDMEQKNHPDLMMYVVIGWYSRDGLDPLSSAVWEVDSDDDSRLITKQLNWSAALKEGMAPERTLLHASIANVHWDLDDTNSASETYPYKPKSYPEQVSERVNISVGSTLADAVSALISVKAKQLKLENPTLEGRLLEAFQYDLLRTYDEPGGGDKLDMEIHNRAFARAPGGSGWILVEDTSKDVVAAEGPAAAEAPAVLTGDQRRDLAALNVAQRNLDIEQRALQSMQRQLHAYWHQWYEFQGYKKHSDETILEDLNRGRKEPLVVAVTLLSQMLIDDFDDEDSFVGRVRQQVGMVKLYAGKVAKAKKVVEKGAARNQRCKQVALDPFWRPNDPVLLITGLGHSDKFDRKEAVSCRLWRDFITSEEGAQGLAGLPDKYSEYVPAGINDLVQEAILLGPAGSMKQYPSDARPELYAAKQWEQPWLPLFLDWKVKYHFNYEKNEDDHFSREHGDPPWQWGNFQIEFSDKWIFPYRDGDRDSKRAIYDYHYSGGQLTQTDAISFSGRTFFTPAAKFTITSRLKAYLEKHRDSKDPTDKLLNEAKALLEQLAQWDILSQSLSGLTSYLAQHDGQLHNAPPKSAKNENGYFDNPIFQKVLGVPEYFDTRLVTLLEDPLQPGVFPALADGVPYSHENQVNGYAKPVFFPLRAGFLEITQVRVVDSFGMIQDLIGANGNSGGESSSFQPILPELMRSDVHNEPRFIRLAPRIVQPSRIDFRLVDAEEDAKAIDLEAEGNPICGWVLPNHVDNGLTVYDGGGSPLGEVIYTEQQVIWRPAPAGEEAPAINPDNRPSVGNKHLAQMLNKLVDLEPSTFLAFMQTVDATLWTIDPLGARDDQNLSFLLGRPLAVVRANIQLQLQGRPYDDSDYRQMIRFDDEQGSWQLQRLDGGISDLSFPVKLGYPELRNDGLIGYYEGSEYGVFNAVHKVDGLKTSSFLRHVGEPQRDKSETRANYVYLQPRSEEAMPTAGAFDGAKSKYLTMLVDPRGLIHALSGILPVKTLQMPAELVAPALEQLLVTFQVGPIVRAVDALRIPRPAEHKGVWQWIQATGPGEGEWQTDVAGHERGAPRFSPKPSYLQEGWLSFTPDKEDEQDSTSQEPE